MKHKTNNGKNGGLLDGKSHSQGGIKAVVTDDNNRPVELETGEAIITKKAVKKHHKLLSKINESEGGAKIVAPDSAHATDKEIDHLAHGGTITVSMGADVSVGDEVMFKNNKWVKITNITQKWVIFTDLSDNKRKDKPIDKFADDVIQVKSKQASQRNDVKQTTTPVSNAKHILKQKSTSVSKFGPGDIVKVAGYADSKFEITTGEFHPDAKRWIYEVQNTDISSNIQILLSVRETDLVLVSKKNHLKPVSVTEPKTEPEFDPQKALDLFVKKNLKSRHEVTLKSRSILYISEFAAVAKIEGATEESNELLKLKDTLKN